MHECNIDEIIHHQKSFAFAFKSYKLYMCTYNSQVILIVAVTTACMGVAV